MSTNRRIQRCYCFIIACFIFTCLISTSCSLFDLSDENLNNEPVGGDWHVWRSYGTDYVLSDEMTVCFSALDSENGYAAYDSASGDRIGNLILPELLSLDDIGNGDFEIEDYDGDGLNDVGITTNEGLLIRYLFVPGDIGAWPDKSGGCFSRIDERD